MDKNKWHKHILSQQNSPPYLPLFIFANGPSTSIELWANSGPLKDCWSCIILPMDGSLPKAPPFQYSDWAPAAKNWGGGERRVGGGPPKNNQIKQNKTKTFIIAKHGKSSVLNIWAATTCHKLLNIILCPSADVLSRLRAANENANLKFLGSHATKGWGYLLLLVIT